MHEDTKEGGCREIDSPFFIRGIECVWKLKENISKALPMEVGGTRKKSAPHRRGVQSRKVYDCPAFCRK